MAKKIDTGNINLKELCKIQNENYGRLTTVPGKLVLPDRHRIPSGIFAVDYMTGGGVPVSSTSCFYGAKSGAKTSKAISVMKMVAKICFRCFYLLDFCKCSTKSIKMKSFFVDCEGCIAEDTTILDTILGQSLTAKEIYDSRLKVEPMSYDEVAGKLIPKPIIAWFYNGKKECYEIRIGKKPVIQVTGNHKFYIYDIKKQLFDWVRADKLTRDMMVSRPRKFRHPVNKKESSELDRKKARLMGYLIGDGGFAGTNSVVFTNMDTDVIKDVTGLVNSFDVSFIKFSNRHYRISRSLSGKKYSKWNKNPITKLLESYGLRGKTSKDKFIPSDIMQGDDLVIGECLSGLYATEGTVNKCRPSLSFCSTSERLIDQVRYLWLRFGLIAYKHRCDDGDVNHEVWHHLTINGSISLYIALQFLKLVGRKGEMLKFWAKGIQRKDKPPKGHYFPSWRYANKYYEDKSEHINTTDLYWDFISDIKKVGKKNTYDFTIKDTHNYVANDIIVHNTFDSGWAGYIGCTPEMYYYGRGDYGEMNVNLAVEAIKADDCGLVVFDSLGALVPEVVMEAPSEDQFYAVQARLITRCVQKIKQTLIKEMKNDHPCAVIFINQKRANIGAMKFESKEKMPGGHAMEHEFSLLLRCVMTSLSKESDAKFINKERSIDVASRFSVAIKKNKIPVIQGVGEYVRLKENLPDLNLKKGQVDDFATVFKYAKQYDIVVQNGSKGWKYFEYTAKKQIDIIDIWKQKESEYFRCQREIIDRAKKEPR